MNRLGKAILSISLAALLIYASQKLRDQVSSSSPNPDASPSPLSPSNAPTLASTPRPTESPSNKRGSQKIVSYHLINNVKKDFHEEPGKSSPGLALFAESLAQPMENALSSPERARAVFVELIECAKQPDAEVPNVVRAVCAANAQRIATKHKGEFEIEIQKLKTSLPPQMRDVLEIMSR